jgi:hypothetical protein|tara:strand:- start:3204 stop:4292 length:1089 start_codon:yes stop_codon:yes gene_type:complete
MAQFVLLSQTQEIHSSVDIGSISELRGNAQVLRDKPYGAELDFGILSYDKVETANGRMGITFIDETQIRLTENSQVLIDEFIFDPDPDKSKMALTFAKGTARFVTGKLNRVSKKNIKIRTNSATIGIRGTDFTITVDELGRSLVILLPNPDGTSSGEITVETAMGMVILNQPYESTVASAFEQAPTSPVILDITLDLIDNMLIVNPPESKEDLQEETQQQAAADYLDFNELEIDYLSENFLDNEAELEFTELDVNYLDVNFLEDLLNVLDALAISKEEDQLKQGGVGIRIVGTEIGQDKDTQITTIISGQNISLTRKVSQSVKLDLDGTQSYTVILLQDGVTNTVKINGGSSTTITIKQGTG